MNTKLYANIFDTLLHYTGAPILIISMGLFLLLTVILLLSPLGKSRLHLVEVLQLIQYLLTNTRLNDADDPRLELIKRFNPQFSFDPPGSIMRKILDRWEQWASERFLSSDDS